MRFVAPVIGLAGILAACATPPDFDTEHSALTASHVTDHILCELKTAKADIEKDSKYDLSRLAVAANVYFQVDDSLSLTPTLTYINPMAMMTAFMFGGSASLKSDRQRIYTENF